MKNNLLWAVIISICPLVNLFGQTKYPIDDYTELTDNKPIDLIAWNSLESGIHFSWASKDVRYSHTNRPAIEQKDETEIYVWRGERASAQAVIYSKEAYTNLKVRLSEWISTSNRIDAKQGEARFVNYVMTDQLNPGGGGCGYRPNPEAFDKSIVADCIDREVAKDLSQQTTRPVWCSFEVPQEALPGAYMSTLELTQNDIVLKTLTIKIHILDRNLPLPKDNHFHLDLWQQPFAVARYYQVPKWSKEHFDAMRPMMQRLARAGQRVITTTLIYEPWGDQSHDKWDGMVKTIKRNDGTWAYDYTVFDQWVSFMMECGIDRQINCYSMVPWEIKFQYYDEATSSYKYLTTTTSSAAYKEFWTTFLRAFAEHLKEKGWFEITTIAMDERGLGQMTDALSVLREAVPEFKMSLQGKYHKELVNELYDYCLAYGEKFSETELVLRRSKGFISTVYTCCTESRPNTFTFSPPAEATWLGIHAAQGNFSGYLRWAYANWGEDPLRDSRYRIWAAGDTYLTYPGNRSSIRFERLIEGVQNYEKIRLLRAQYIANNETEKLEKLNIEVDKFNTSGIKPSNAGSMVRALEILLNDEPEPPVVLPTDYCNAPLSSTKFDIAIANRWLTSCTTTGAEVNLNYTASTPSTNGYILSEHTIEALQGSSFTLNFVAANNNDDLRYSKLAIFADWNGDKIFSETTPEVVHKYGNNNQANPALLNYTTTINIPESAKAGNSRIRIRFTDAWSGDITPCDEVLKGFTLDIPLLIKAPTDVESVNNNLRIIYSEKDSKIIFTTEVNMTLYSASNGTVIAKGKSIKEFDTSHLSSGMYICTGRQGDRPFTHRFIKVR